MWVKNNYNSANEVNVDNATSKDECIANVRAKCPTATIANYEVGGNACYCQFGTNMDLDVFSGWENCLLTPEHPKYEYKSPLDAAVLTAVELDDDDDSASFSSVSSCTYEDLDGKVLDIKDGLIKLYLCGEDEYDVAGFGGEAKAFKDTGRINAAEVLNERVFDCVLADDWVSMEQRFFFGTKDMNQQLVSMYTDLIAGQKSSKLGMGIGLIVASIVLGILMCLRKNALNTDKGTAAAAGKMAAAAGKAAARSKQYIAWRKTTHPKIKCSVCWGLFFIAGGGGAIWFNSNAIAGMLSSVDTYANAVDGGVQTQCHADAECVKAEWCVKSAKSADGLECRCTADFVATEATGTLGEAAESYSNGTSITTTTVTTIGRQRMQADPELFFRCTSENCGSEFTHTHAPSCCCTHAPLSVHVHCTARLNRSATTFARACLDLQNYTVSILPPLPSLVFFIPFYICLTARSRWCCCN